MMLLSITYILVAFIAAAFVLALIFQAVDKAVADARPTYTPEAQYNGQFADADTSGSAEDTTSWPDGYTPPHYDHAFFEDWRKEMVDEVPSQLHTNWSKLERELNQ